MVCRAGSEQRLIWGFFLVGLGLWFLAERLIPLVPGMEQLWPLFLALFGGALLGAFVLGGLRAPRLVLPGLLNLLLGGFFLAFTLGILPWRAMAQLWPMFPLIVGVSFFGTWAAGRGSKPRLLVPAAITGGVGLLGLAATLTPLRTIFGVLGWPIILIGVGGLLVLVEVTRWALEQRAHGRTL